MDTKSMLEMINTRIDDISDTINMYYDYKNIDGEPISKGHAATAMSLAKKEKATLILLKEVLQQTNKSNIVLSSTAEDGLFRLCEPIKRKFKQSKYNKDSAIAAQLFSK